MRRDFCAGSSCAWAIFNSRVSTVLDAIVNPIFNPVLEAIVNSVFNPILDPVLAPEECYNQRH